VQTSIMRDYRSAPFTILEYGRCSWGACYFCGWGKKRANTTLDMLKNKYIGFLEKNKDAPIIKIFSSGSMIDPRQFPLDFTRWLIEEARRRNIGEIVIEGKADDVNDEVLEKIKKDGIKITIAIGLEIADDIILKRYYLKNTGVVDYIKAAEILKEKSFGLRTYVIVNAHPIMYRNKIIEEALLERTIVLASIYSDSIVIINAYPHKNTRLVLDWIDGRWKPLDKKEFFSLVDKVMRRVGGDKIDDTLYVYSSVSFEVDN